MYWKEEIKLCLFTDNTMFVQKNPKEFKKQQTVRTNKRASKVIGYRPTRNHIFI